MAGCFKLCHGLVCSVVFEQREIAIVAFLSSFTVETKLRVAH